MQQGHDGSQLHVMEPEYVMQENEESGITSGIGREMVWVFVCV